MNGTHLLAFAAGAVIVRAYYWYRHFRYRQFFRTLKRRQERFGDIPPDVMDEVRYFD